MRRAFGIDVLAWPRCGGRLRRIATVEGPAVVGTILAPLGLLHPPDPPGPAPARSDNGFMSPTRKVFVNTDDVDARHRELSERPNPNMRPSVVVAPWNAKVIDVIDPFGE